MNQECPECKLPTSAELLTDEIEKLLMADCQVHEHRGCICDPKGGCWTKLAQNIVAKSAAHYEARIDEAVKAERSRLAAMAPEGALLSNEEIQDALHEWTIIRNIPSGGPDWNTFMQKKIISKVWSIAQARIDDERERTLIEVGEWIEQTYPEKYCWIFDKELSEFKGVMNEIIQALKQGKMPNTK